MQDFAVVVDRGWRFMWCELLVAPAGVVLGVSGKPLKRCFVPAMDDVGQRYCLVPPSRSTCPGKGLEGVALLEQ